MWQIDFIVEPVVLFHGLLCGINYNGKAAKIHCAVERGDCATIKHLSNKCADLFGITMCGNWDQRYYLCQD